MVFGLVLSRSPTVVVGTLEPLSSVRPSVRPSVRSFVRSFLLSLDSSVLLLVVVEGRPLLGNANRRPPLSGISLDEVGALEPLEDGSTGEAAKLGVRPGWRMVSFSGRKLNPGEVGDRASERWRV